jgi:hypothetical protein
MIKRRMAVLVSAAALTGGAIAGCGSDAATTGASTTQSQQQPAGQPPLGGGIDAAALAEKLGVSEAKVQAALQDLMPQGGPPQGGQAPSQDSTNS